MNKVLVGCLLSCLAMGAQAQSFCFLSASSYYEQVYCELQARGEARGLPPFHQFKRNDEQIQATILRRPAARIGIDLPMPERTRTPASVDDDSKPAGSQSSPDTEPSMASEPQATPRIPAGGFIAVQGCSLQETRIHCGDRSYQLVGNRLNHRLAEDALTEANTLSLPVFSGDINDRAALDRHLAKAYTRYIEKMHDIGLAGATLTYGKFVYLFHDIRSRQLDFSGRFETMYRFLKRDKSRMSVSERTHPDADLAIEDCTGLSGMLLLCERGGKNYLYQALAQ